MMSVGHGAYGASQRRTSVVLGRKRSPCGRGTAWRSKSLPVLGPPFCQSFATSAPLLETPQGIAVLGQPPETRAHRGFVPAVASQPLANRR